MKAEPPFLHDTSIPGIMLTGRILFHSQSKALILWQRISRHGRMPQMDSGKALAANLWRSENTRGGAKTPAQKRAQANAKKPGWSRSGVRPPLWSNHPPGLKTPGSMPPGGWSCSSKRLSTPPAGGGGRAPARLVDEKPLQADCHHPPLPFLRRSRGATRNPEEKTLPLPPAARLKT